MRLMILICAATALPLLAASGCGNAGGGGGSGGHGTGGHGTGGHGGTPQQQCGGGGSNIFLVPEDVCIDGTSGHCLGDGRLQQACTGDTDCPENTVCRLCDATRSFCDAPCIADGDCWGGTCDATGHCHPEACTADDQCQKNFTCSTTESICVRKVCSHDTDCDGVCLSGRCSATQPFCTDCT